MDCTKDRNLLIIFKKASPTIRTITMVNRQMNPCLHLHFELAIVSLQNIGISFVAWTKSKTNMETISRFDCSTSVEESSYDLGAKDEPSPHCSHWRRKCRKEF